MYETGVLLGYDEALETRLLKAINYRELRSWFDEDGFLRLLLASYSHHGKPIVPKETEYRLYMKHWDYDGCVVR